MRSVNITVGLVLMLIISVILVGCGGPDYTTEEFENALNNGDVVEGKTVSVKVTKMDANTAFGYNIQAGEHLNFVSAENPKVKEGDTVTLKVERVANLFGSYIITYIK